MSGMPDIGTSMRKLRLLRLSGMSAAPQHAGAQDRRPKRRAAPAPLEARRASTVSLALFCRRLILSWSEHSCSDNLRKLAHPDQNGLN